MEVVTINFYNMFYKITLFVSLFILISGIKLKSQSNLYHQPYDDTITYKPGDLLLDFEINNFFINNEYNQSLTKGYTLPGQYLKPVLKYYSKNEIVSVEVGLKVKHFFGQKGPLSVSPTLRLKADISPSTSFIIGSLKGYLDHNMSDVLYRNEAYYTGKQERGVQLLHSSKYLTSDLWVNWEDFIEHGDTIPEMFTSGLSAKAYIIKNKEFELSIPIQTTIVHVGGEISDFPQNGRSDMNNLFGLEIVKSNHSKSASIGLFSHFLHYRELKSKSNNFYRNGNGVHSGVFGNYGMHNLNLSFWRGDKFLSLRGNPLYQSKSDFDDSLLFPIRNMITGTYMLRKELSDNFVISLLCGGYYDFNIKNLDYLYSIQLFYAPKLFIKKSY